MDTDLSMEVGRIGGRLSAVETRQDRVDDKLDAMDAKLDTLIAATARGMGMGDVAKWLLGALFGASGWIYTLTHLK